MKAHVFALCLSLCLGLPLPALAFASPFTDVQETSPYYDAILWAAETGVTNGTTASTFSPDAPCTRAQLAVFLWRAAGEPKPRAGRTAVHGCDGSQRLLLRSRPVGCREGYVGIRGPLRPMRCVPGWTRYSSCGAPPAARIWKENFPFADVPFRGRRRTRTAPLLVR